MFDVPTSFQDALDILYLQYIDRKKSTKERKIYRMAWTRGVPPLRSFEAGHVFYDPPGVRSMVWRDALRVLRRCVQVREARPDAEKGPEGWVRFEITHYEDGRPARREEHSLSQADFEAFLRIGAAPERNPAQM